MLSPNYFETDTDHFVYSVTVFPGTKVVDMQYANNHAKEVHCDDHWRPTFINHSLLKIILFSQESYLYDILNIMIY